MERLIDFDREFMKFAALRLRGKGELKDDEITAALNEAMAEWLATESDLLGGKTPDGYFAGTDPEGLVCLLDRYCAAGMSVPEPLYRRISGEPGCESALTGLALDENGHADSRATALRLLCDLNAAAADHTCIKVLLSGDALYETASERLKRSGYHVVEPLTALYESADSEGKAAVVDILACYPGIDNTCALLIDRLYNDVSRRAMYAAYAARFGDDRLIEPLQRLSQLSDLEYVDYKEIVNAIDALGGDPGEEREFYGDPDYEALRVADTMPDFNE